MSTGIIRASFDPVSKASLQQVLALRKEHGFNRIILEVTEKGILPQNERLALLKKAIRPFRKLSARKETKEEALDCTERFSEEEACIRGGHYRNAASGIRRDLAEQGLYLKETVAACCKPKRAGHSLSAANVSKELAEAHGLDGHKAWMAGCMHDLTKAWSDERGRAFLEIYEPDKVELDPKIYHSFTAPVFLKTVLGVEDEIILNAVRNHTLGTVKNDYDRILYIADKIEPTRGYDVTKEMDLSRKDLRAGFDLVYHEAEQYRRKIDG